jgi:hypothetical protein
MNLILRGLHSCKNNDKVVPRHVDILCLIKHHAMNMYGGMEVHLHTILSLALDWGVLSASGTCYFTLRERSPSTHWIWSYMSPIAGLGAVAKRKIALTVLWIEHGHAAHSPVSVPTGLPQPPTFLETINYFLFITVNSVCVCVNTLSKLSTWKNNAYLYIYKWQCSFNSQQQLIVPLIYLAPL